MASIKAENPRRYELNNVVEAFILLAKMLDAKDSLGLTQLSTCTGFSKNKAFRLLSTLERCGIVEKDTRNNYTIGIATIGLAHKIMAKSTVLDNVRPYMEGLAKVVNEAVYFAYYTAGEAVLVDYADCCHPIKATSFVGKAIQLPDSTNLVICGTSVTKIGDISVDVGSLNLDITTVSIPFVNDKGVKIGALVVLAPTFRMPLKRIKTEVVPALREVMQRQLLQLPDITQDTFLSLTHPVELTYGTYSV